jgi:hypothetical protein
LYITYKGQDGLTRTRAHLRSNGKTTLLNIRPGSGIDRERELLHYGLLCGALEAAGTWYTHGSHLKVHGIDQFCALMRDYPDKAAELALEIRARLDSLTAVS